MRRSVALLLLFLLLLADSLALAAAADDWLLVEFSSSPPACEQVEVNDRCWSTQSAVASFEMRAGETLNLPTSGVVPPAWARLQNLWVYAPDAAGSNGDFTITLDRTPVGARLMVADGEHRYLQSLPLNRWIRLEENVNDNGHNRSLWTRVSGSSPR